MGFVDPLVAIIIAICFLIVLLYKRVNLGIALNATALLLALLAVEWAKIPSVLYQTTVDSPTVSVVLATFGIMLLSQLYKETRLINKLSESIGRLINNPKAVLCAVPAVIGLLPVSGGALMSAPIVDSEAEKLKLTPSKKAYVNLWFRHTVFPVYPLSPVTITAALLTGVAIPLIIVRQIPVVLMMITVGYVIGFWKVSQTRSKEEGKKAERISDLRDFFFSFSPILVTIVVTIVLDVSGFNIFQNGFDVVAAIAVGLAVMIVISKMDFQVFVKPFKTWGVYGVTFAAYGAFLLRTVIVEAGISGVFSSYVTNGSINIIFFLAIAPRRARTLDRLTLGRGCRKRFNSVWNSWVALRGKSGFTNIHKRLSRIHDCANTPVLCFHSGLFQVLTE